MKKIVTIALAAIIGMVLMSCSDASRTPGELTDVTEQSAAEDNVKEGGTNSEEGKNVRGGKEMREFNGDKPEDAIDERREMPEDFGGETDESGGKGRRGKRGFNGETSEFDGKDGRAMSEFNGEAPEDPNGDMPETRGGFNGETPRRTGEQNSDGVSGTEKFGKRNAKESADQSDMNSERPELPNGSGKSSAGGRKTADSVNTNPDAATGATQKAG